MTDNVMPVSFDTRFNFLCAKCIPCFNECCKDLNQFLTPYDIIRIKNGLKMSSFDFLQTYCKQHTGPESGFPVVTLKPVDTAELKCPFVTPSGCKIYEDRPSSCRMYPLVRAISRNRETGKITEQYMLLRESHCQGFEQDNIQTVGEWVARQGLVAYNELNDMLMELISIKNQCSPGPMDPAIKRLFQMACYDLDNFRPRLFNTRLFDKGLLSDLDIDPHVLEMARDDDVALLKIGMKAVKKALLEKNR